MIILIVLIMFAVGYSIYVDVGVAKYWIYQNGNITASATSILKEEEGCAYFMDAWTKNEGKICGNYLIKNWSKK